MKIDPRLIAAIADLQRRCSRRTRGRVVLTVELDGGDVIRHRCDESDVTTEDVRRWASELPRMKGGA